MVRKSFALNMEFGVGGMLHSPITTLTISV